MKNLLLCLMVGSFQLLPAQDLPEEQIIDEYDESSLDNGESVARFTYADQYVYISHEDGEEESAIRNVPVVSGDYLETRQRSYAEIEFIDGSLMQIADRGAVEFQAINEVFQNESLSVIKLHRGSLFLHVTDEWYGADIRIFRIDTLSGSAYIQAPGIYRVDLETNRMKLKVYRGFGELSGADGSVPVYSGEYSTIRNLSRPTSARSFNSFHGDSFERWAYERRPVTDSVSANYVDARISNYSRDLDDYGEWRYSGDLNGHVWVPYVSVGWRPYHRGYWTPVGSALTWISFDPFGWVTHHYGRWGWSLNLGWYWIPGRYYSPAWVAWSSYNSYVGWCPLGYFNRPYYYRDNRPDVVIINNHHQRWNYVSTTTIINRGRAYPERQIAVRGTRRITTRSIHVSRDDLKDSRRITTAIRDPKLNRSRDTSNRVLRGGTLVTDIDSSPRRVRIKDRDTGTKAVSRHLRGSGSATVSRTTSDGASIFRWSGSQRQTRQSDLSHGLRRGTQENRALTRPSARGGNDRVVTRRGSASENRRTEEAPRAQPSRVNPTRTAPPERKSSTGSEAPPRRATRPAPQRDNRKPPEKEKPAKERDNRVSSTREDSDRTSVRRSTTRKDSRTDSSTRTSRSASATPPSRFDYRERKAQPTRTRANPSSSKPRYQPSQRSGSSSRPAVRQPSRSRPSASRPRATTPPRQSAPRSSSATRSSGRSSRPSARPAPSRSTPRSSGTRRQATSRKSRDN